MATEALIQGPTFREQPLGIQASGLKWAVSSSNGRSDRAWAGWLATIRLPLKALRWRFTRSSAPRGPGREWPRCR